MVEKWRIRRVMRKERHESISFDPSSRDKPVTGLECPETRGEGQEHRERRKCKYIYIYVCILCIINIPRLCNFVHNIFDDIFSLSFFRNRSTMRSISFKEALFFKNGGGGTKIGRGLLAVEYTVNTGPRFGA